MEHVIPTALKKKKKKSLTALAHSRRVIEAIRPGSATNAFQAPQQLSTIAA